MQLYMQVDVPIMRRSKRHVIRDHRGSVEYVATDFSQAIDYLRSIECASILLIAGDKQLRIDLTPAALTVADPRQLALFAPGVDPNLPGPQAA